VLLNILFLNEKNLNGQHTLDVIAGIGFPELLTTGFRAQLNQVQIGFKIGSFPFSESTYLTLSGEVYYHFGEHVLFTKRKITYIKVGLNYFKDENAWEKDVTVLVGISVGRDIYISRKMGINLDCGLFFKIKDFKMNKESFISSNSYELPTLSWVMPYVSLALFYRL
jgi:hypothetical protein